MRRIAILLAFCFILIGCKTFTNESISPGVQMQRALESRGVTVVVLGDQIMLVMPSSLIFERHSARIMSSAYSTLDLITAYINNYTKMLVNVNAYTGDSDSRRIDLALSKEQSVNIIKYMQNAGIDARVLHAGGRGGKHLVEKNSNDWDFSMNYRIEITMEKLYV